MMNNHIVNINSDEIKKIYTYSDRCLECIIEQKSVEPFENFNRRNRKSVITHDDMQIKKRR